MNNSKRALFTEDSVAIELERLLSEDIDSAKERAASLFSRLLGSDTGSLVLFGAGQLGRKILAGLRIKGIEPLAFVDNNSAKWRQVIDGLWVLSPQEAAQKYADKAFFVITVWNPHNNYLKTKKQLLALNCFKVVPFIALFWQYPDLFLPHCHFDVPDRILVHSQDIKRAFSLLVDEESRRQYAAQLRWRLLLDFGALPQPSRCDQYFPPALFSLSPEEVFIDGGAFDGDTVRNFIARQEYAFRKIIAFEPDPVNYKKLVEYVSVLDIDVKSRIETSNLAIARQRGKVRFDTAGTINSAINDAGTTAVESISLDEALGKESPTLIKLDIEGAEYDALVGAQAVIRNAQPVLAVCVYHRPDDLWRLPLYLDSLNSNYRLFFRTHEDDGFGLVCYAVPVDRVSFKKKGEK